MGKKGIFLFFCVSISPLLDALIPCNCHSCISSMGTLLNVGNFVMVEHSHVGVSFENGFSGFRGYEDSYCGCLGYNTVLSP